MAARAGRANGVLADLAVLEGATIVAPSSTDIVGAADIADAARAHGGTAAIVHPGARPSPRACHCAWSPRRAEPSLLSPARTTTRAHTSKIRSEERRRGEEGRCWGS